MPPMPIVFDAQGRLICWVCKEPTLSLVSKKERSLGKIFYKCDRQSKPGCDDYFQWKYKVDRQRNNSPVDPPATMDETAVAAPVSTPTAASGVRTASQSVPTRTRSKPEIDLSASPIVTLQRHLSHQSALETVPGTAATPTMGTTSPGAAPPHTELADHQTDSEDGVPTDDEFVAVDPVRDNGIVYPALPDSTQGSISNVGDGPIKRRRERMPGTFTNSTESSSGHTASASAATGRVHEWAAHVPSPRRQAAAALDPVITAAPTQDMAPSLAGTAPSAVPSSAARMHGLHLTPSPPQSPDTVRVSEPTAPVHPKVLQLTQQMQGVGRDFLAAEQMATTQADRMRYLEAYVQALLKERVAMQEQLGAMQEQLDAAHARIEALENRV